MYLNWSELFVIKITLFFKHCKLFLITSFLASPFFRKTLLESFLIHFFGEGLCSLHHQIQYNHARQLCNTQHEIINLVILSTECISTCNNCLNRDLGCPNAFYIKIVAQNVLLNVLCYSVEFPKLLYGTNNQFLTLSSLNM